MQADGGERMAIMAEREDAPDAPPPNADDYRPPRWLRNPHVQSVLGTSPLRHRLGLQQLAASGARHASHILDGGDGVRLQGWLSVPPGPVRGTVLLLHGWEGSSESNYMLMVAAQLLRRGYQVFRLNFRDHGGTYHLNVDLFHSDRIAEVVNAALDLQRRFPSPRLLAAGYSLGGNFVLRLALRAPAAGLALDRVAAVCPLVDPASTMEYMEHDARFYNWYFKRKWRESLLRKRALFPERYRYDKAVLDLDMRGLTAWLAERYAGYASLQAYFDSYTIGGARLARMQVPADILMAHDDPVIPFTDFRAWQLPAHARLQVARWGGHCGFLENARGESFADRWVTRHLTAGDD